MKKTRYFYNSIRGNRVQQYSPTFFSAKDAKDWYRQHGEWLEKNCDRTLEYKVAKASYKEEIQKQRQKVKNELVLFSNDSKSLKTWEEMFESETA